MHHLPTNLENASRRRLYEESVGPGIVLPGGQKFADFVSRLNRRWVGIGSTVVE